MEVESPDWETGAGYSVDGDLVPGESCACVLTPAQESAEWDTIAEKACEYPQEY